jgi:pantoate--beta-alanine ligase
MEIINRIPRMISVARQLRADGIRIGLVPTGGIIHEGHLSMISRANELCDSVILSILPNHRGDDFALDLARDAELAFTRNVDFIFAPSVEDIFSTSTSTMVVVEGLHQKLEGAVHPGHYQQISTAVNKLLNITRPQFVVLGRKDAQRAIILKRMVRDLAMDVEVVICPTVREEDGLAISSSNARLSTDERKAATVLRRSLERGLSMYSAGERDGGRLISSVRSIIETEPLAQTEYVALTDIESLDPVSVISGTSPVLLSLAAFIGPIRLTDNIVINGDL